MPTKTKKISGKVYRLYKRYPSGYKAKAKQAELRKKGKSARIVIGEGIKYPYDYYLYVR